MYMYIIIASLLLEKTDNEDFARQAQEVTVSNSQILSWRPKPTVLLLDHVDKF